MKKLLFSSLLCVVSLATFAATVTHDGVTYSTSGTEATVTSTGTLSEVVLPEYFEEGGTTYTVVGFQMMAIYNNSYITSLHIPSTITDWGMFGVYGNSNLKTITFGDGLTSIGNGAFSHNSAVEEIDLSNTKVESVGEQAFEYCSSMKTLLLPSTLVYLHYQAFSNCTSLTSVTCFAETPPVKDSDGSADSWASVPEDCILYVPAGCAGAYSVAERWSRFAGHIVELSDSTPLEDGDIFEDDGIYYKVVSSEEQTVEVTWGGENYHSGTESYTGDMSIPESVTYDSVTYTVIGIGEYAFHSCSGLTSISLLENITYIGSHGFYGCSALTTINIPEQITRIEDETFSGCSILANLTLPNSVTYIGASAFYNCKQLVDINFPTSLTQMGNYAFRLTALTNVDLPSSLTTLGTATFYQCYDLEEVTIPESVTTIPTQTFYQCTGLKKVHLHEKLTSFGNSAFNDCTSLEEFVLPSSVSSLGSSCFKDCTSLSSFYALRSTHPTAILVTDMFENVPTQTCILYVPVGSKSDYSSADNWKDFYNIVEMQGTLSITSATYATFYADYAYVMPEGVTGTTITAVSSADSDGGHTLTMPWEYEVGATVPAHTALVLQGAAGEYTYAITTPEDETPAENLLMGSATEVTTYGPEEDESYLFYELTNGSHGIGFYWANDTGEAFQSEANKAWLPVDTKTMAGAKFIGFGNGDTTGITSVETSNSMNNGAIYTLQGVRVSDMNQKGIYIVNGKKVLVK